MARPQPRSVLPDLTPIHGSKLSGLRDAMDLFGKKERHSVEQELEEQARARRRAEADASTLRLG
jgi:hypothetical protein